MLLLCAIPKVLTLAHQCVSSQQEFQFPGVDMDFATRQSQAEERRKLRLMQLRQAAWENEEAR